MSKYPILLSEGHFGKVVTKNRIIMPPMVTNYCDENGRTVKNYGEVNNHPAIIDKTTWNAVQAEMERRVSLRTVEESGKGRYSGCYAFSGKIECGCCGAGYRRHHQHGERAWVCKQHIKSATLCEALPIRETALEAAFVRTLNGIILSRDAVMATVGMAVNEALREAGEDIDRGGELRTVDGQIEALQARILELNKQRTRREIDTATYTAESREVMEKLDALFIERDAIACEQLRRRLDRGVRGIL